MKKMWLSTIFVVMSAILAEGAFRYKPGETFHVLCDDCFKRFTLNTTFVFFCKPHNDIFVNENGVISFDRDFWPFVPDKFPLPDEHSQLAIIAGFWADHFMEGGGKVYTKFATRQKDLVWGSNQIKKFFKECHNGFFPKVQLIITFEKVFPYCKSGRNSYQIILMTDGIASYVLFDYETLEWAESCNEEYGVAGFHSGTGKLWELPGSGTSDVVQLTQKGNTRPPVKGRWAFKVSGSRILTEGCNQTDRCAGSPPAPLCSCKGKKPVPPRLLTYDNKALRITRPQATLLAQWGNSTDPCGWSVVAHTFKTHESRSVPLFLGWMSIFLGPPPIKSSRSYQFRGGNVFVRAAAGDYDKLVTLPHHWVSDDQLTDITIDKEDDTIRVRGSRCPYSLDVAQEGRITTSYAINAAKRYDEMDGMCGDCDGDAKNDARLCGHSGGAMLHDKITKSCKMDDKI